MKFFVLCSVFSFCFFGFVKAEPEPGLITSATRLVNPITSSLGIPNDLLDLLSCLIVEIFIVYTSILCASGLTVDLLASTLACIAAELIGPLGALFTAVLNTLVLGVRALGTACDIPLTYWNKFVGKKCPALTLLNGVLLKLAGIGSPQSGKYCGSEGFSIVVCLLLEVFIFHLQIICAAVGTVNSLLGVVAAAAKSLPSPLGSLLQEINEKLIVGLETSVAPCQNTTNAWINQISKLCTGGQCLTGLTDINKLLNLL